MRVDRLLLVKDREESEMSNLTEEEIRRIGCNEWARYMDEYGYGRPSYLRNQCKRAVVVSEIVKQQRGGNKHASQAQAAVKQRTKNAV